MIVATGLIFFLVDTEEGSWSHQFVQGLYDEVQPGVDSGHVILRGLSSVPGLAKVGGPSHHQKELINHLIVMLVLL